MSPIAALAARRALYRQSFARLPSRRFASSKVEEASLDKAPKRDPELYVRRPTKQAKLDVGMLMIDFSSGPPRSHVRCLPACWMVINSNSSPFRALFQNQLHMRNSYNQIWNIPDPDEKPGRKIVNSFVFSTGTSEESPLP
jgi:hypothetical protein